MTFGPEMVVFDYWMADSALNKTCDEGIEGPSEGHCDMDEYFTQPFTLSSKLLPIAFLHPSHSPDLTFPTEHIKPWGCRFIVIAPR